MPARKNPGFTIVELLIVIVVIAILAAISVVAYTGIQNRAHNTAVQSDLKSIATKIEMHNAEQGVYPSLSVLATLGLNATKSAYDVTQGIHQNPPPVYNLMYCVNPGQTQFALIARAKSGETFQYSNGSVGVYQGPILRDSVQLCSGAGVTVVASATDWRWLYYANAWQSWVGN